MGLFQKAVETYDAMHEIVGTTVAGKETLAPIGHIIKKVDIEITLDGNGTFVNASNVNIKVAIPCTEESSGRTSAAVAHPLCDYIEYVALNGVKHDLYMAALKKWTESKYGNAKLTAIYNYLKKEQIYSDLNNAGLLKFDNKMNLSNSKDIITWRVIGIGDLSGAVYEDRNLQESYYKYYMSEMDPNDGLCMVYGDRRRLAKQHIKGISSFNGNAKIISANDTSNYTYKGRFKSEQEALTVSYEASQKAHNALKWILANNAVNLGNRAIICWNPMGKSIPKIDLPIALENNSNEAVIQDDYSKQLEKIILGYRSNLDENSQIIIAAFDAATTGRLALTYYNELLGSDFLERLRYWDETCCWISSRWGISSPSLYQIVDFAFGTYRGDSKTGKFEVDDRVKAQQMQRLIACRIDKGLFPIDIMRAIVSKCERLQLYSRDIREKLLFTTCAVIRKCRKDNFKEEWKMALEPDKKDRSYQYGRLLAVLEKIERDTYDDNENRETNAIRAQALYVQRPQKAFAQVMTQIKSAYYPRLRQGTRVYYDNLITEIMDNISQFSDVEIGRPLSDTYLMGYYMQKKELYTSKRIEKEEE